MIITVEISYTSLKPTITGKKNVFLACKCNKNCLLLSLSLFWASNNNKRSNLLVKSLTNCNRNCQGRPSSLYRGLLLHPSSLYMYAYINKQ